MQRSCVLLATLVLAPICAAPAASTDAPDATAGDTHTGIVHPYAIVTLAASVEGILAAVPAAEGRLVQAGEPVAIVDDRVARASVKAARLRAEATATITRAEVALATTESELADLEVAHRTQAASNVELRRLRATRDKAGADLAAAREVLAVDAANLALEERRLDRHVIRAPFEGRIVHVHALPGTAVNDQVLIAELADLSWLTAEINLPSNYYGTLMIGWEYPLEAHTPVNRIVYGRLRYIDPILDSASGRMRCVFDIENTDEVLPAGFTVSLAESVIDGAHAAQVLAESDCPE